MAFNLQDIQNGMVQSGNCNINTTPIQVVQAPCTDVCAVPVTQPGTEVRLDNLIAGEGFVYEADFQNRTDHTVILRLSALTGKVGDYQVWCNEKPCEADEPLFVEVDNDCIVDTSAGGSWRALDQFITINPAIISRIEITTALNKTINKITSSKWTPSMDKCAVRDFRPICNLCDNNNNSTTFTSQFDGAFPVGKNTELEIPVPSGITPVEGVFATTTVRVTFGAMDLNADLTATGCSTF